MVNLLPKTLSSNTGAPKLVSCPRRHPTPLAATNVKFCEVQNQSIPCLTSSNLHEVSFCVTKRLALTTFHMICKNLNTSYFPRRSRRLSFQGQKLTWQVLCFRNFNYIRHVYIHKLLSSKKGTPQSGYVFDFLWVDWEVSLTSKLDLCRCLVASVYPH